MERKFRRNMLKKIVGAHGMKGAWQRFQMKKYKNSYHEVCRGFRRRSI